MDIFLINSVNPAAESLAEKMSKAKHGSLIMCSEDEIKARRNGDVEKVSIDNCPSPSEHTIRLPKDIALDLTQVENQLINDCEGTTCLCLELIVYISVEYPEIALEYPDVFKGIG